MAIPALGSILTFLISVSYGASELPCKIQAVEAALNERIVWITEDTLTRNHAILAAENPNTVAGLFGPDSIMWKIFRERAVKFGAALPYVLIQLGDPRVAYGVSGFSRVKTAPIDRLNATFGMMGNLIYGDRPTQFSIARKIFEIHRGVKGVVPKNIGVVRAGETFSPNNGELLRWSLGVLWHLGIKVQERFVGPLTAAEKVQFHKEMGRFNLLMGIPEELNPASYEAFVQGMETGYKNLVASKPAKEVVQSILGSQVVETLLKENVKLIPPSLKLYLGKLFVSQFIPRHLAKQYGLPGGERPLTAMGTRTLSARAIDRIFRAFYTRVPDRFRVLPTHIQAMERVRATER